MKWLPHSRKPRTGSYRLGLQPRLTLGLQRR
jgi:hypothetical protein